MSFAPGAKLIAKRAPGGRATGDSAALRSSAKPSRRVPSRVPAVGWQPISRMSIAPGA